MCISQSLLYSISAAFESYDQTISWIGHMARIGEMRGTYKALVLNREGKRLFGKLDMKREDNNNVS
jgi:hypothetical protein